MPSKDGRSTEHEIGQAALRYLHKCPGGRADIAAIKDHIRKNYPLTDADCEQSETRPNEEMWEQQVRNLVSHRGTEGNIINDGLIAYSPGHLEITDAGNSYLKMKGL
jgi:hypothetical protein